MRFSESWCASWVKLQFVIGSRGAWNGRLDGWCLSARRLPLIPVFSLEFGLEKAVQGVVSQDSRAAFADHRKELIMQADVEVESSGVFKGHPVSFLLCIWGLSHGSSYVVSSYDISSYGMSCFACCGRLLENG